MPQRFFLIAGFAIIMLQLFCFCGMAQGRRGLPDSIVLADTASLNDSPGQGSAEGSQSSLDSSYTESNEKEDSVYVRAVPESVADSFRRSPDFEYANDPAYWREVPPKTPNLRWLETLARWFGTPAFKRIVLILVIGVLVFALYKIIVENRLYLFYSPSKRMANNPGANEDLELTLEELESKISESLAAHDYRSAFRFMYLKLLRTAGEKGLIQLHMSDTNKDYVRQLQDHPLASHFRFLTNAYEYVWYGGFHLQPDQFQLLQNRFDTIYNHLTN